LWKGEQLMGLRILIRISSAADTGEHGVAGLLSIENYRAKEVSRSK
jgi:hypothetical protein